MTTLSVGILFHAEGLLALPAIHSLRRMVAAVRADGAKVEVIGVLDNADEETTAIVEKSASAFDRTISTSFGDPAKARNEAVRVSAGDYVALLDGDDLWGEAWLKAALLQAKQEVTSEPSIWHPEWLFLFSEEDFAHHVTGAYPSPNAKAHFVRQVDCLAADFDPAYLLLENAWSANSLYHRCVWERFPYPAAEPAQGTGVEDWAWNTLTFTAGIRHRVVSETVHMIRMKATGSLNTANVSSGVLPDFAVGTWTTLAAVRQGGAKPSRPHGSHVASRGPALVGTGNSIDSARQDGGTSASQNRLLPTGPGFG